MHDSVTTGFVRMPALVGSRLVSARFVVRRSRRAPSRGRPRKLDIRLWRCLPVVSCNREAPRYTPLGSRGEATAAPSSNRGRRRLSVGPGPRQMRRPGYREAASRWRQEPWSRAAPLRQGPGRGHTTLKTVDRLREGMNCNENVRSR